jgi:hypothetical protein
MEAKRKEELSLSERIINYVREEEYGIVISHDTMELVIGVPRSTSYYFAVSKANKALLRQSKMLKNIPGQGYVILDANDYSAHSVTVFHKGYKTIKHAKKILDNAPMKLMSQEAVTKHNLTLDRVNLHLSNLKPGVAVLNNIQKKELIVTSNERVR